jgi:hypothetical protein
VTLVFVPSAVCDDRFKSVECGVVRIGSEELSLCGVESDSACCGASSGDVRDTFASEVASALAAAVVVLPGGLVGFTGELVELSEELSEDALATCLTASPWPNHFSR